MVMTKSAFQCSGLLLVMYGAPRGRQAQRRSVTLSFIVSVQLPVRQRNWRRRPQYKVVGVAYVVSLGTGSPIAVTFMSIHDILNIRLSILKQTNIVRRMTDDIIHSVSRPRWMFFESLWVAVGRGIQSHAQ